MISSLLINIIIFAVFFNTSFLNQLGFGNTQVLPVKTVKSVPSETTSSRVISIHEMSLEKRYSSSFVNNVFKDNILLNIAYMQNKIEKTSKVNWEAIVQPFHYEFRLNPNEVFAFHDTVLPEYEGKIAKTTNAHFNSQEQFKSDGYLFGDGVCHLASLIYWVAKDAKLDALAPTNHNFMTIPEVPREFGVSIYVMPGNDSKSANENLYVTNNKKSPVTFKFDYDGETLKISVSEEVKKLAYNPQP